MGDAPGYVLPESIYGLVIAEPLQLDRNVDGNFIFLTELLRGYFLLVVNYAVQGILIYKIQDINNDKEGSQCFEELHSLQCICVFVFCVSVFAEFRDACSLLHGLWMCPSYSGGMMYAAVDAVSGGGQGAVLEADSSGMNVFGKINVWAKKKHVHQWNLDRMTAQYKFFSMLIVGVPRLIIPAALTYVGAGYIMRSEDAETMILNTLAVLFIIDIDEFLFNTFTTTPMKHQLANMKEVEISISNTERFWSYLTSSFGFPAIIVLATCFIIQKGEEVCGYR